MSRHEIGQRNTRERDGNDIMNKREDRFATCAEIAAEAKVNAGKNAVPNIAAEILRARANNYTIGREYPDYRFGCKLHYD